MLKVVNHLEGPSKWIDQNLFLVSIVIKYFAPAKLWLISSRVGGLWHYLMIALFRSLKSRFIQCVSSAFFVYVNEDIHGVGATSTSHLTFAQWCLSVLLGCVWRHVGQKVCLDLWLYGSYQACCVLCQKSLERHLSNFVW